MHPYSPHLLHVSAQKPPPPWGLPWPFCRTWHLLSPTPTHRLSGGCRPALQSYFPLLHLPWFSVHVRLVAQSCPMLCDPLDYSPPGSSVHGILQARILEWIAVSSSRGSSRSRELNLPLLCLLHYRQILYLLSHQGSPVLFGCFILLCFFLPKMYEGK